MAIAGGGLFDCRITPTLMKKSGNEFKFPRRPTVRLWRLALVSSVLVLIAVVGTLYGYGSMQDRRVQVVQKSSAAQDASGGLQVLSSPSNSLTIGTHVLQPEALLQQINIARSDNGLAAVSENALLDQSAKLKLDDMVAKNYWAHTAPDGTQWYSFIRQAGYIYSAAAENLAYGQFPYNPEQTIVDDWLNSPEHRQNMLASTYTEIGIALEKVRAFNGQEDVYVIVTHYGKPANRASVVPGNQSLLSDGRDTVLPPVYAEAPMPSFSDYSLPDLNVPSHPNCGTITDSSYYANCMRGY